MTTKHATMTEKSLAFLENLTGKKVTLGNTLWAIRECEKMTQVEMAKLLGISRQNLCDIEHGRRFVGPRMAATFSEKLGYSIGHFVQMALQDELRKAGLSFNVTLDEHKRAA